jgi:hypothetical protein
MAKKMYRFNELSDLLCSHPGCIKRIKKNLVERKPTQQSFKCYKHHMQDVYAKRNKRD